MSSALDEEGTLLEHTCRLTSFTESATHHRLTGIVGSISQASQDPDILMQMILAGMTIARLNFSHDTQQFHENTIKIVRAVSEKCSKELGYTVQVGIALDTKGPEIRTGFLEAGPNAEIELKVNDSIRLSTNRDLMDKGYRGCVYVDYENIINVVLPGNLVYIDDANLELVVKDVGVDCATCQVVRGGMLGSRKKMHLPGAVVDLPAVSEKDRSDLKFAINHDIDIILASSIRSAAAVTEIRTLLGEKGKDIKLIAKIDNQQGLQNVDEILAAADGILFARADVAIEIPLAKVFLAQKAIIARCNRAGKPIIIATHFLETMRYRTRPTTAEISDLGNAVLDGADCVMLSSQTAVGKYPVETVVMMNTIIRESELALWYRNVFKDLLSTNPASIDAVHAIAIAAVDAAKKTLATAIIVLTTSGRSAHLLAKYRPRCPILAVTRCSRAFRQAYLHRGIIPMLYTDKPNDNWLDNVDARVQYALNVAKRMMIVNTGDTVVIMSPWKDGPGFTNNLRLVYAFFEQEDFNCMLKTERRSTRKLPL